MSGPWLHDRVRETTTTTGTGTLTLAGAVSGWRTFTSVLSNGDTVYYSVAHQSAAEFEWGIGTFTTSGTTLARTTVLGGSNGASAVNFSAGTKDVFISPLTALMGDRLPEISVTGATTATIDRTHVCSGTSSDYTVTLPAASGNAGRRLWFRMAPLASLSRRVTLDGNSSETIDGATTRVMWAGETAELWCDGSNWFKVAGRTIPMRCVMRRTANQTGVATATLTAITLNGTDADNTAAMADTSNNRMTIRRAGDYLANGLVVFDLTGLGAAARVISYIEKNENGSILRQGEVSAAASSYPSPLFSSLTTFSAGDTVKLKTFQNSGSAAPAFGSTSDAACTLTLIEQPSW